ncbi:MAG TPA: hypothetical protein VGH19_08500 [Verrucomicrobiae bacterium]
MNASFKNTLKVSVVIVLLLAVALGFWLPRAFRPDPKAIAAAETRMWQAYYAADPIRLHTELVTLMQSQFKASPSEANAIAQRLVMAAWKFETSSENYEAVVLPDLEVAFDQIRKLSHRTFDSKEAARAELAWWVARRTPGQDSAQQVGQKIGAVYAILYGSDEPGFTEAGVLRAQAGKLRDDSGAGCDWRQVEALLQRSYQALVEAI